MYKDALRPAWAEINLTNLEYNIDNIKAKIGGRQLIGVIKADAYGHGAVRVAEVLRAKGCRVFAIATLHEAIELREAGAEEEIIMLGLTPDMYADTLVDYRITPVVCDLENARAIAGAAAAKDTVVDALLAVDTGMGRIGYLAGDLDFAVAQVAEILKLTGMRLKGLFSHMATADAKDKAFSREQERRYNDFYAALQKAGVAPDLRTFANSASIMEIPSVHFDACRPGIILYGCYPSDEVDVNQLSLKPVMSIKANIVHLKDVPVGASVGYGRRFIAERPSKIATLALGYADGLPRPYSQYAKVIVGGMLAPVAGNVCMDQCMVDVTDVPGVKPGDEVILMGSDGVNTILADDIAKATGTINYEITCAFGQRLPKVYVR